MHCWVLENVVYGRGHCAGGCVAASENVTEEVHDDGVVVDQLRVLCLGFQELFEEVRLSAWRGPISVAFLELVLAEYGGPEEGWGANAHDGVFVEDEVEDGDLADL